ncbi:hypothetical protein [Nocardioides sp. GXQ0305]|uniref:hypothetical protein n=1 Tax=Nocardioides sp. GXQ0305 TaxID=3423912 RepID=UPI003D7E46D3
MSTPATESRPWTVTTVVVLATISGLVDIIGGISLWFFSSSDALEDLTDADSGTLVTIAVVSIVLGLITVTVAFALGGGSNAMRTLIAVLMAIRIAGAVYVLFAFGTHQLGEALISIVVAAVTLSLLYNDRANAFFGSR